MNANHPFKILQRMAHRLGVDIRRSAKPRVAGGGRAVGIEEDFLEDIKARGAVFRNLLDVGGNVGYWSRMAKKFWPDLNCFLIEPQSHLGPHLDRFCAEFPGSRWVNAGAGSAPGELTLTLWEDSAGSSFLPAESTELKTSGKQVRVPIVTIDSLIESGKFPVPDLVKIDVQGFEIEALKGATKLFGPVEAFIIEVSLFRYLPGQPLAHEVVSYMGERGYVVYDFPGFLRRPADGALGQCDICFVRDRGTLRTNDRWE